MLNWLGGNSKKQDTSVEVQPKVDVDSLKRYASVALKTDDASVIAKETYVQLKCDSILPTEHGGLMQATETGLTDKIFGYVLSHNKCSGCKQNPNHCSQGTYSPLGTKADLSLAVISENKIVVRDADSRLLMPVEKSQEALVPGMLKEFVADTPITKDVGVNVVVRPRIYTEVGYSTHGKFSSLREFVKLLSPLLIVNIKDNSTTVLGYKVDGKICETSVRTDLLCKA